MILLVPSSKLIMSSELSESGAPEQDQAALGESFGGLRKPRPAVPRAEGRQERPPAPLQPTTAQ